MNEELLNQGLSETHERTEYCAETGEDYCEAGEAPWFVVPSPPVPGKTAWSIAPW